MPRRGRVELRRIEDPARRKVRFCRRRAGLLKKAFELSLLCDAEVALLVFSPAGKLYEYASASVEDTYNRYKEHAEAGGNMNGHRNRNDKNDEAYSDLQSMLTEIATWYSRSPHSNASESDAKNELEKMENLLTNALRDTRSLKVQMLAKQNSGGSMSGQQGNGASGSQEQGTP